MADYDGTFGSAGAIPAVPTFVLSNNMSNSQSSSNMNPYHHQYHTNVLSGQNNQLSPYIPHGNNHHLYQQNSMINPNNNNNQLMMMNANNNQQQHYHGVDIDTATIVSIASSCIILISGCIAVVCLIMYMKKTDMLYRSRTCAKCGAHVNVANVVNENENVIHNNIGAHNNNSTPISIRSERQDRSEQQHVAKIINYQLAAAKSQQNLTNKELDSIVIYRGLVNTANAAAAAANQKPNNLNGQQQQQQQSSLTAFNTDLQPNSSACVDLFEAFKNNESKTSFIEPDDEAAPYATFNLPGFESDSKISDTYETFAAKFSEPPYMLLKKGIECPPQYADSISCKLRMLDNDPKVTGGNNVISGEPIYQSTALSQYHSIASCSSNQEELILAYEYGKEQKQKLLKLQNEVIKQLANGNNNDDSDNNQDNVYRSMMPSDHESPTDPGIREFTKSPPKPNEKRQGIVFHHQPTVADILKISKHMIDQKDYDAKVSLNQEDFKHELSSNETTNSLSSLKASSGSGNSSDDSTPSAGSELGNDEATSSTSSTATPENISDTAVAAASAINHHHQAPPQQPQTKTNTNNNNNKNSNNSNFGAISRDRSRNPSWATYTTMKSNTVLTNIVPSTGLTTTTNESQTSEPKQKIQTKSTNNNEINNSERAFVSFAESTTKTINNKDSLQNSQRMLLKQTTDGDGGGQEDDDDDDDDVELDMDLGLDLDLVREFSNQFGTQQTDRKNETDFGQSYESSFAHLQQQHYHAMKPSTSTSSSTTTTSTYFGNDYYNNKQPMSFNNNHNNNLLDSTINPAKNNVVVGPSLLLFSEPYKITTTGSANSSNNNSNNNKKLTSEIDC